MKTLLMIALCALACTPLMAATPLAPETVQPLDDKQEVATLIRTAVEKVVALLRKPELSREEKREGTLKIIEPLIDFELLAKLSLGKKNWNAATPDQREKFIDLFVETLKISYFEKLELFSDEEVEFDEPVPIKTKGAPKYSVMTYILSKGERIKDAYKVTRRDKDVWRAYDFEIEGVSIQRSYGSQYNDFLKEKSFDELLTTMREKIAAAKKKEEEARKEAEKASGDAKK